MDKKNDVFLMKIIKTKLNILFGIIYIIYIYNFVYSKIQFIDRKNEYLIKQNDKYLKTLINLKERPSNPDDPLIKEEKKNILNFISNTIRKRVKSIKKLVYLRKTKFGNTLLCLNKLIFFCEIIGCNEITLHNKAFWFIKNKVFLNSSNITINAIQNNRHYNLKNNDKNPDIIYYKNLNPYFYYYKIKPEIRIHLLKNEIISNLPIVNVSKTDLYMHIRSGDIFINYILGTYSQPPLCFYTSIIQNFNFTKIYIISQMNNNPVINKLKNKYSNIVYSNNEMKYDLSCLIHSYNLVASISSFLNMIILLNSNLQYLWEYNLYQMKEKFLHNHYDLFKFPNSFTVYRMEPSMNYKTKMSYWKNSRAQRKLMINEKCINSFMISRS